MSRTAAATGTLNRLSSDMFMGTTLQSLSPTTQNVILKASTNYLIMDTLDIGSNVSLEIPATSTLEIGVYAPTVQTQPFFAIYDFIESGCVWTADAAGSSLNATMSTGYVWIAGRRLLVNPVKSRAFTASKDTYVDFSDNGDGTANITYTENTNNLSTGAPALNSGYLRNAIIVTAAGSIAAAASINQGQESIVVPIVSSIPYAVTDSLGNLICPRDPNRKLLGQRQLVANFSPGATAETLITGLNCPVIIPLGRKVKISASHISSGSTGIVSHRIYEGIFGSGGTQKQQANETTANGSVPVELVYTPTTSALTYTATIQSTATNPVVNGAAANPAFLKVELD